MVRRLRAAGMTFEAGLAPEPVEDEDEDESADQPADGEPPVDPVEASDPSI
jgi:hypothetical protein